jgi:hypothetical protein
VEKPVSKFAFQMQPAALHRESQLFCNKMGAPLTGNAVYRIVTSTSFRHTAGLCTLNQVDP